MQKGDLTIAFKTIALSNTLSECQKRVAAALLDHFNRQTGRCDPSHGTLADILGVATRTVSRATKALEAAGYFRTARHGGKFQCNQYTPVWSRFREADAVWDRRRRERRARFERYGMSSAPRQACRLPGDDAVTQTCRINLSKETSQAGSPEKDDDARARTQSLQQPTRMQPKCAPSYPERALRLNSTSASDAMREAAHRRWDDELLRRFRTHSTLYGRIIELIDHAMADAATDAELQRRHAGMTHILQALITRDPALACVIEAILRE